MVNQFKGSAAGRRSSRAATASPSATPSARRWRWPWSTARCATRELGEDGDRRRRRTRSSCSTTATTSRPPASSQHLKLPHYVDFQSELELLRTLRAEVEAPMRRGGGRVSADTGYNFAYLDEQTKRMIRRAHPEGGGDPRLPGAVRPPRDAAALRLGHRRHPGDGRRASGRDDALKVIDQGADDTTNAVTIRRFFARTTGVRDDDADRRGDAHPDPAPHPRDAAARGPDPGLPGADPGAAALARAARDRDPHACTRSPTTA